MTGVTCKISDVQSTSTKHVSLCYFISQSIQTRAPRGTDRSPEYNEHFCDLFCLAMDPPLGRYGQNFRSKHPLCGSVYVVKADYVFPYIYTH